LWIGASTRRWAARFELERRWLVDLARRPPLDALEAALAALVPPVWATKEVTRDPRYQCGSLVQTNAVPEVQWPAF
jgi:hypothetical protein